MSLSQETHTIPKEHRDENSGQNAGESKGAERLILVTEKNVAFNYQADYEAVG